jgi:glycosyltransferase involved in cell wall biosynthesis
MLAVIETHPIQYHAPVYRLLEQELGIPVTAIYGSDFSVAGYVDREFGARFAWDTDLLAGYSSIFLSRVAQGGAASDAQVTATGLDTALARTPARALLLVGYSPRFYRHAFLAARSTRKPLLFRAETTDHAVSRSRIKALCRDVALRWLYKRCSRLLYVGYRSKRHFERLGFANGKLVFSPYCVNTSPFQVEENDREQVRAHTRARLGIREDDIALIFSGKLSHRKAPDLLVAAARELPKHLRAQVVILFMGDGELKSRLADLASHEPQLRAVFLGFQNQTAMSPFYHAGDALVLPSLHSETWGLVVNEALHHGLPCVVSDAVGCGPDLIKPGLTGEVAETGSMASLTAALTRVMALTGKPATRSACRSLVSNYSTRRAAEGIAEAYRHAVTNERPL